MKCPFTPRVTVVHMVVAFLAMPVVCVLGDGPEGEESKVFPMSTDTVDGRTPRPLSTSVRWKEREYGVEAGIDLVMSVIRRAEETAGNWNISTALGELANLGPHLRGRACLDELGTLYDRAQGLEKRIILRCFVGSGDPRGIRVFIRTLDREQNMKLRLSAAAALAQWNIRRGVAELVGLLESNERVPMPSHMPYVRDNALDLFSIKNRLKGWRFPDEEVRKSIETRADLDQDQKRGLYIAEIRKWFAENEHRFPDWKPGDPLPEAPAVGPRPKGSE